MAGEVSFEVCFGQRVYLVNAIVTPTLASHTDLILGLTFLNENHTSIQTTPGQSPKFCIDGQNIPVIRQKDVKGIAVYSIQDIGEDNILEFAKVSKYQVLKGKQEGYLKVRIPYNTALLKENVLFHPLDVNEDEIEGVTFTEALINVRQDGTGKCLAYIGYINYSDEDVCIKRGEIIGGLSAGVEIGSIAEAKPKVINNISANTKVASRWERIQQLLKEKCTPDSEEESALLYCMNRHQRVVQLEGEPFRTTNSVEHFIDYQGPKDLFTPQYKIPFIDMEDTDIEVDRLVRENHVRDSKSGFNSPIIPVRKKDRTLRIVHDFRNINKFTRKQRFPLPNIDQILNSLSGARYFVVLDLKSGYFQIRLCEESIPLTAFRTAKGCYEYLHMPFGLANAPSTMQRLMLNCVQGLPNTSVFLDDLLIYGATLDECAQNLDRVLGRLEEHNLTIKLEKCSFFKSACKYLGHVISQEGIRPDPEKVAAVKDFPVPNDLHGVRSFLGLTSYYRKFIKGYSAIAAPLHDITKGFARKGKSVKVEWGDEHQRAFCALKDALAYDVCLAYPNFELPFILTTDASDKACGGTLSQKGTDGVERPITFFSKKFLDAETRYDAVSRECLAIIHGLKFNRPYILGREVSIASDNRPLLWLLQASSPSQRVARWQILVSEYNIVDYNHVSGKSNLVADALSRHVPNKDTIDQMLEEIPTICSVAKEDESLYWDVDALPTAQDQVILYKQIKDYLTGLRKEVPKHLTVPVGGFVVEENILYLKASNSYEKTRYRTCLPKSYTVLAMKLAHDLPTSGHPGVNGTIERLKRFAYWPTLNKDVKEYVKRCRVCLKTKSCSNRAPILRNPEVQRPWDRLNLDLIGPLPISTDGNKFILSVVDVLTRYAIAVPIPDKSAATVARALINNVFAVFGPPRSLYSDQGKEFVAQLTIDAVKAFGCHQRHITVYRPQASGIVERFNGHIVSILRALAHEHQDSWDISLPLAILAHNTAYHRILKETPYFLLFLRDANVPYEMVSQKPVPWYSLDSLKHEMCLRAQLTFEIARKYIEEGKIVQEKYANQKAKPVKFRLGDRVYVKKMHSVSKLSSKFVGPMRIIKLIGVVAWVKCIVSFKTYKVHIERLKLEQSVSEIESPTVQAAFPTREANLHSEYERVTERELVTAGLKEANVATSVAERFLNQELSLPSSSDINQEQANNSSSSSNQNNNVATTTNDNEATLAIEDNVLSDTAVAEIKSNSYPLRSNTTVEDTNWVMPKALEYKR